MPRITVTVDENVAEELERRAGDCGIAVPTLVRLIASYWSRGHMFKSPNEDDATELQAA